MDPPPLSATTTTTTTTASSNPLAQPPPTPTQPYPDSLDSSPRSYDDPGPYTIPSPPKLRLMCSYNGHIVPRPHDKSLCYIGGETRMIVIDRNSSLPDLTNRLSKTLLNNKLFTLKYQLPNEDLDSLISITTEEDLDNMIDEYDRLNNPSNSQKSSRIRLFLFPVKHDSGSSINSILENSTKSEDWFLSALNTGYNTNQSGVSESSSVNCLLGLDEELVAKNGSNLDLKDVKGGVSIESGKNSGPDVHSVPDSPMLETTSSFGSTSSSPSLTNLPPIRVGGGEDQKVGTIEEQFGQMSVVQQKEGEYVGFMGAGGGAPPQMVVVSGVPVGAIGEYSNRVFSDDERSEQGVPVGYRQPSQAQMQCQLLQQTVQQKATGGGGGLDLASPDSVSSDVSVTNPLSRQQPMIYQDPMGQIPSGNVRVSANPVDPNTRVQFQHVQQVQQVQDSGYVLPSQFDQQHQQFLHQQQQQQFGHTGAQYIHQHPSGAAPMTSYYSVYPSQQQYHPQLSVPDQQYSMFYVPARQAQAYNMPGTQQSYGEAANSGPSPHLQTAPPPTMVPTPSTFSTARNVGASKGEMVTGVYRTANSAAPSFVQVPSGHLQQQYVGYSQIHHQSQSIAPNSTGNANYAYEFVDPTHSQMYYNQTQAPPQLAAQYQTMTSSPLLSEASVQLSSDSFKQQTKTSQP